MSKNRKKPVRRKGQMKQWSMRALNTGPTEKSEAATESIVLLAQINGHRRSASPHLETRFPGAGQEGKNSPRLAALRRRAEEKALELGSVPETVLNVLTDRLRRVTLHFNKEHTRYWFQREDYNLSMIQTSVQYSSLTAARMVFMNGSVSWCTAEVVTSIGGS